MNRSAISIAVVTLLASSLSCSSSDGAQTPAMTQAGASPLPAAGQSGQAAPGAAGTTGTPTATAGTAAPRAGTTGAAAGSGGVAAPSTTAGSSATAGAPGAAGTTATAGTPAPAGAGGMTATAGTMAPPEPQTCPTTALAAGDSNQMIDVGGTMRAYIRHVPRDYDGKKPVPMLIDWHPLGQSAQYQRGASGYAAVADREGFIVLYPDGIDNVWNIGPCCTRSRMVDDLGFARAMIAKLEAEACIDKKRIYSAGYSMGGGMTLFLGCNAADVFAAISPAAFDLLTEEEEPCKPARPITVITFRGTSDPIVPYAGGASNPPTLGYTLPAIHFLGAEATFKRWQELNMCTGMATGTGDCKTFTQCAGGVETTLCTKQGGSHVTGDAEVGWATMKRFTLP